MKNVRSHSALRDLFTVTELAQGSSCSAIFRQNLLDHFQRAVGYEAAFFMTRDNCRPLVSRNIDEIAFQKSLARWHAKFEGEMAPVKRRALQLDGVAVDTAVLGETRTKQCYYFRELAGPAGGRHSLMAYARLRGKIVGTIMLGRNRPSFRHGELNRVRIALPAIAMGLATFDQAARPLPPLIRQVLSPREINIVQYLHLGYTNREIALACGTSPNTVRNQLARIFEKIGASTRAELVAITSSHNDRLNFP